MDKEMGPDVGELWRKPNTLKRFPCPVTNKTEDFCSVWRVPKAWQSMTEDDIKAMQLESERDGKEGDEDIVQLTSSMSAGSFAMINGGLNPLTDTADDAVTAAGVEVKIEPKDPREELMG